MTELAPALRRLIEQVQQARARKATLEVIGGGTKRFYGEPPRGEPLATTALSGISSHEPTELVVTARAGTPLAELEAALAVHGQCLPFEPPRFATGGTVGGMVAAGLSGPSRAALGGVRNHVLGVTMLNGCGELLSFGGQVIKNVAGYDISRLMAGSMGVLGVICEVSLKVMAAPPAAATLRFECDQAEALQRLHSWGARPLPLNASAWCDGILHLRLAGARAAVASAVGTLGGEPVAPDAATAFWDELRDQRAAYFADAGAALARGMTLWRLSVPPTVPPLGLPGRQLIEWGGGQRWLTGHVGVAEVRTAATTARGHATLFRSLDKCAGVFAPLTPALARLHRDIRAAFDPDAVFDSGRLYGGL